MQKKKIVIIGSGQHGRVVLNILKFYNNIEVVGFIDDDEKKYKSLVEKIQVIGTISEINILKEKKGITGAIIAIGMPKRRIYYKNLLDKNGIELINCIHPTAILDPGVKLGVGIVIDAGTILSPNPVIEDLVIINPNVSVNHDNILKEASHLAAGVNLGGNVTIGERTIVGIGASIAPAITIGNDVIIGVGASIMKPVSDFSIMIGNPARLARKRSRDEIV